MFNYTSVSEPKTVDPAVMLEILKVMTAQLEVIKAMASPIWVVSADSGIGHSDVRQS